MYNTGERSEPEKNTIIRYGKNNHWTPSPTHQISAPDHTSDKSQGGGGVPDPRPPPPPLNPRMELLAGNTTPLDNICYLLFLDLIKWFSSDNNNTSRMRFNNFRLTLTLTTVLLLTLLTTYFWFGGWRYTQSKSLLHAEIK